MTYKFDLRKGDELTLRKPKARAAHCEKVNLQPGRITRMSKGDKLVLQVPHCGFDALKLIPNS
ncbi:hypothetical protein [Bradyrhizobium sp. DASA03120]|uniref:hypothetical protein n=1 Tax=Bradyrhizobium sp. SMVTL-02 TaxID=3395917 RepID=UPI003F7070E2